MFAFGSNNNILMLTQHPLPFFIPADFQLCSDIHLSLSFLKRYLLQPSTEVDAERTGPIRVDPFPG